jgi:cytochrome c oxidase assembly protein Cox11
MVTVADTAYYVRSKNAGPFWVTVDIFCDTEESYQKFAQSKKLTKDVFAEAYGVDPNLVKIFYLSNIKVIKISYPRPYPQGGKDERDMHAGQQYAQILDCEI